METLLSIVLVLLTSDASLKRPESKEAIESFADNEVIVTSCIEKEVYTEYKYIVLEYPDGDKDIYCSIGGIGDRMQYLSLNDEYVTNSTCIIDKGKDKYWSFAMRDSNAAIHWHGSTYPIDAAGNKTLSKYYSFSTCIVNKFKDKQWQSKNFNLTENK